MEFIANRDVYGKTLVELGRMHPEICVLDADLSESTRTKAFAKEFPDRFFNMGVAEQNLMGFAAGLASCGKVSFVSTFAMFGTGRAWEQIRNTIAYTRLNVKLVFSHAGLTVGEDGSSHQSLEDIAIMRAIPDLTIIVPCDGPQTKKAIIAGYRHNGPVYIRLSRAKFPVITKEEDEFIPGKAEIIQEGKDAAIIACGLMTGKGLAAAGLLQKEGIQTRVINMHTIKPIDRESIINAAQETGAIVTAEEHSIIGGLGSAVAEVTSAYSPAPIEIIGTKDVFGQSGSPDILCKEYNIDTTDIVKAVKRVIKRKR